jgi:hypothetical protein
MEEYQCVMVATTIHESSPRVLKGPEMLWQSGYLTDVERVAQAEPENPGIKFDHRVERRHVDAGVPQSTDLEWPGKTYAAHVVAFHIVLARLIFN